MTLLCLDPFLFFFLSFQFPNLLAKKTSLQKKIPNYYFFWGSNLALAKATALLASPRFEAWGGERREREMSRFEGRDGRKITAKGRNEGRRGIRDLRAAVHQPGGKVQGMRNKWKKESWHSWKNKKDSFYSFAPCSAPSRAEGRGEEGEFTKKSQEFRRSCSL